MQNHCDLWNEINDEHCKRWKHGFDKQPAGTIVNPSLRHPPTSRQFACNELGKLTELSWPATSNVLLVKKEGPVTGIPSIDQPMGNWDIYAVIDQIMIPLFKHPRFIISSIAS